MDNDLIAIMGSGGFAREVLSIIRRNPAFRGREVRLVDDHASQGILNDAPVITTAELLALRCGKQAVIAIADAKIRRRVAGELEAAGIASCVIAADNIVDLGHNAIGPGAILCPFATISANAVIGRHFHCNLYSYVAHDCIIGDFVTFAPRVCCNGGVVVEDDVYIGTNAIIKQAIPDRPLVIGRGSIIGMGVVVTRSVPPGTVVIPAREIVRKMW